MSVAVFDKQLLMVLHPLIPEQAKVYCVELLYILTASVLPDLVLWINKLKSVEHSQRVLNLFLEYN